MRMNSCQHTEKLLAYRLGLLTESEAREFEHHLEECPVCQRELKIESAIEGELSVEFQPGFIETRVRAHVQLRQARDMRSFWLYSMRIAIYGVVAIVIGLTLMPFILKFPFAQLFDLSNLISGISQLTSRITIPAYGFLFIIGLGYILTILSSIYSFARIQK